MGVHSFIIYTGFYRGCKEAGANPSWPCVRDGVHPGQVTNLLQGLFWDEQHVTPRGNFRGVSWPNLYATELWEETGTLEVSPHRDEKNLKTQHKKGLADRFKPRTFLPWGTTVRPLIWSCLCKSAPRHQAVNLVRSEAFKAHNSLFVCLCAVLKIYIFFLLVLF